MSSDIAARLFVLAHDAEMLTDGYAWIVTDSVGNMFSSFDQRTINSMQGVLGVRPYVPPSDKLINFPPRFVAQYQQQNPGAPDPANPNVFHLWAYDTAWAIAMALRKVGPLTLGFQMPSPQNSNNSNDLSLLGVSQDGPVLINAIRATRFQGISGDFVLVDGQLQASVFEIFNVIGNSYQNAGFWTPKFGLSKNLIVSSGPSRTVGLNTVLWPGGSVQPPRGWEWPVAGKKLQIAVPVKPSVNPFVNVKKNVATGKFDVTGYCIDIFEAVMREMPYAVPYEYVPVVDPNIATNITLSYSEICYQVSLKVLPYGLLSIMEAYILVGALGHSLSTLLISAFRHFLLLQASLNVDERKIRSYRTNQYAEALMKGSWNGGVAAVVDEIPYLKLFMSKHCRNHSIIGRVYKTGGFGFVFPKGSPLVTDVSRAILKVTEGDEIVGIERKWLGLDKVTCNSMTNALEMGSVVTWSSLKGVFFITFGLWGIAGIIYIVIKFWPWRQIESTVQEAVAEELVLELSNGDEQDDTIWPIERNSHLVFHLRGHPPQAQVAGPQGDPAEPPPAQVAGPLQAPVAGPQGEPTGPGGHQEQRN
ncbi:glutamate receptor 2.5-like [Setaria viridis]|uniref:glutamate receptor 2.5-like n=1 Tax=Setaria viridis TaxID=4556 RepID=UPI003B3AFFC4